MQKYTVVAKAHLVNSSFANFYSKFHRNDPDTDILYKKIAQYCEEHKQISRSDVFKSPYNSDGFYFKVEPYVKCSNKNKKPCIIDDLYDTDVMLTVKVIPYDLIDSTTQQRRVGVTIKVISVKGL